MYLLNKADITENRPDIVECFDVTPDETDINDKQLLNLLAYCNPGLNNKLVFNDVQHHMPYSIDTPLHYPITTLLLVRFSKINWQQHVDSQVVKNIYDILSVYDPTDLTSIYNIIKDNEEIASQDNEVTLSSYLEANYPDINLFRGAFKHLNFNFVRTLAYGNYKAYTNAVKSVSVLKSGDMKYYGDLNTASVNSKTLKLLQLTPNIK